MLLTTTETIAGRKIEHLGMVQGSVVQSKHIGKDIMAGFKTLVGGEIKGYTEMMEDARRISTARMEEMARGMGADAIVMVRFSSASVMDGAAEILIYGTAVKFVD
ncbi:heavy metal-binding domain-containing protein [Ruminococcaceae bacterium OttesenSCG-928-L11]|nr:heavy metal-binding domain-containing protein [Ruminococcaceae bacterium OttesenSCG-928-L11]